MSLSVTNRPSGRAKSCVVCRQFKLGCDARRTAPNPCTRCVSKNLECRFDPNFKRISTRRIAQELTDGIHRARAAQNPGLSGQHDETETPASHVTLKPQSPDGARHSISSASSSFEFQSLDQKTLQWLRLPDTEQVTDQTFHGITIRANRILKLFFHFDRYMFSHARFMQPLASINKLAAERPFLFWTILLVAVERYEINSSDGTYERLCAVHEILMQDIADIAIQNIEIVHALLLLSLWPIPKARNAYDPAWNYVGLATTAALSLNCHDPWPLNGPLSYFKSLADTPAADLDHENQAMTWLGCFQVSARISISLGLPPIICSPQYSRSLRRAHQLASNVLAVDDQIQIRMLDILTSAQLQLDAITDCAAHYTMTQIYETQIDDLRVEYSEKWSWDLEAQRQSLKMYLLGLTLTLDLPPESSQRSQAMVFRQLVLDRSFQAACSYISTMTDLSNQSIPGLHYASGVLTFYPKHWYTSLMAATCYIFRYLVAFNNTTHIQQTLAITRITDAHRILQSFPEHRDAVRACVAIEMIVDYLKANVKEDASELLVKSRFGASVWIDASFRANQQCRRNPIDGSSPPVKEWSFMHEDSSHGIRLPAIPGKKIASPPSQPSNAMPDPTTTISPYAPMPMPALDIWNTYSDDFGLLNEPWMSTDAEFAMLTGPQDPQQSLPLMTASFVPDLFANPMMPG